MRSRVWLALLLSIICAPPLAALEQPRASPYDARVKAVVFNADDVVQVDAVLGVATHIVLEEGETILTHAFGDSEAYDFEARNHHLFVKPKAEGADTNLVVVTDRRSYKFRLTFKADKREGATYELLFRFPGAKVKEVRARADKAEVERRFQSVTAANLAYAMSGDLELAPVHAWDDGKTTFFRFASGRELPAIYVIDAGGAESVADRAIAGAANDVAVVNRVAAKWVLRLGDRALAIWNETYDQTGPMAATGTVSPLVTRVVKPGQAEAK